MCTVARVDPILPVSVASVFSAFHVIFAIHFTHLFCRFPDSILTLPLHAEYSNPYTVVLSLKKKKKNPRSWSTSTWQSIQVTMRGARLSRMVTSLLPKRVFFFAILIKKLAPALRVPKLLLRRSPPTAIFQRRFSNRSCATQLTPPASSTWNTLPTDSPTRSSARSFRTRTWRAAAAKMSATMNAVIPPFFSLFSLLSLFYLFSLLSLFCSTSSALTPKLFTKAW